METAKWPAIIGLVVGTFFLSRTVLTTFIFDKPLVSYPFLLYSAAAAVLVLGRYLQKDSSRTANDKQYTLNVPGHEVGEPHPSREPSPLREDERYPSSLRKLRLPKFLLAGVVCLRVELLRYVLDNTQCNGLSWEPLIPFIFASVDYWYVQQREKKPLYNDPDSSVYDALEQRIVRSKYRYLVTVGLISFGALLALALTRAPPSTYICASTLSNRWLVPVLQRVGTLLDVYIAYGITALLLEGGERDIGEQSQAGRVTSVGWVLVRTAQFSIVIMCIHGALYFIFWAGNAERIRMLEVPAYYISSLLKLDIFICATAVCALLAIIHVGLTTVSIISTFVSVCTVTTTYTWNNLLAFPPTHGGIAFVASCVVMLGFACHFNLETTEYRTFGSSSHTLFKKIPSWFYIILLIVFFIQTAIWAKQGDYVYYHPIDMLIYDAQSAHEAFVGRATISKDIATAVKVYRGRYSRHPPPGFGQWYDFAWARNSLVIDEFDSIDRDILPFYSISPEEIRYRTWQMMANPWHHAVGISIRNGKWSISSGVSDMHRWKVEEFGKMIEPFIRYLPDMDLVINVDYEPRIVVPYREIKPMTRDGRAIAQNNLKTKPTNAFSKRRAEQWAPVPEKPGPKLMKEMSWQRTFHEINAVSCPPGSTARDQRIWDRKSLCTTCAAPHSMGAFLANWTKAADICHQPDLADLHGLYISLSPARVSHTLFPIFSPSKAHGFNDLLYPGLGNWLDNSKYAPNASHPDVPFANKNATLYWRGATSEGMSTDRGEWKGTSRQRFLHALNDINVDGAEHTLLLPYNTPSRKKLKYTPVLITSLTKSIKTDTHFVEGFLRCTDVECPQQAAEFRLADPVDFQEHWAYKYLLDLDGAGFSDRFFPFLFSRSLPFKAGILREWWDDRVTAWKHFVPLDIRGHGLWATLAYFAGADLGSLGKVEAHEKYAEMIAEDGRKWAETVLRREDMEVYLFRLLLEWGRVTDDRRDEIGFTWGGA